MRRITIETQEARILMFPEGDKAHRNTLNKNSLPQA